MADDKYRGFQDRVMGDVGKAALQASSLDDDRSKKGNTQKLRVRDSDLPTLIPPASTIEFEAVAFGKLKFGDIIFVRFDRELCLRRFIRLSMNRDGSSDMNVTHESRSPMVQLLPCAALIGRVVAAEYKGKSYNPHKLETGMTPIKNRLTEFGTTNPLEKMLTGWQFFYRVMSNKKKRK